MSRQTTITVDAPAARRRSTGLFVSFPPLQGPVTGFAEGLDWEGPLLDHVDSYNNEICPDNFDSKHPSTPPYEVTISDFNVTLTSGIRCKTVGHLAHENYSDEMLFRRASEKLIASAAYVIGEAISTGQAWRRVLDVEEMPTGDREIAHALVHPVTGDPVLPFGFGAGAAGPEIPEATAVTPSAFISNMENLAGDQSNAAMAIYLPAIAGAVCVGANGPVFREGETFRTALGTEVVFPWGLHGKDPRDGVTAAPAGQCWGALAGRAHIWRSGVIDTASGDFVSGVNMDTNGREFWVEEDFSVGFEEGRGAAGLMLLQKE